jgi:hypothetical protein
VAAVVELLITSNHTLLQHSLKRKERMQCYKSGPL